MVVGPFGRSGRGRIGLAIAYASASWSRRRKDLATLREQDEAVREFYQQEELERRHSS